MLEIPAGVTNENAGAMIWGNVHGAVDNPPSVSALQSGMDASTRGYGHRGFLPEVQERTQGKG
jgi:hypothetical protein